MSVQKPNERLLYELERMPTLQNQTFETRIQALTSPTGKMRLIQDLETGLVRNSAFAPEKVIYDQRYQNEQSLSVAFKLHLAEVQSMLLKYASSGLFCEVGCGKGFFLEMMQRAGADILGFDPAYEGNNSAISKTFFDGREDISADCIVLRHVLEHIENPFGFIHSIAKSNHCRGLIYIEVPCLDWILANRTWFDVFYEHVNYFRIDDFRRMFGNILVKRRGFGGQYLMILAEISSLRDEIAKDFSQVEFPNDIMSDIRFPGADNSGEIAIWGASSKGVIYSLLAERAKRKVGMAIDINPAKQGRFLPVTGVKVVPPLVALGNLAEGTEIVVMNPNYKPEIQELTGGKYVLLDAVGGISKSETQNS